ncbi:MAG TPA: VOC family protein [Steroidobacteraceae bacterium]|nr:VOC family protein [Steroidobacteraceae bacterium]
MKIIGPDTLIFGVDDIDGSCRFLTDYGLKRVEGGSKGATFEALDGTGVVVRTAGDAGLPAPVAGAPNIREQVYGVADAATLAAIGAELARDREVRQGADGVLHSVDDDGYPLGFQVTRRRPIGRSPALGINTPGAVPGRAVNVAAARDDEWPEPYTLSHIVLFTRDRVRAEKFYAGRLGFRTTDVFTNVGPFMRPAGTLDHHTLFLIETPVKMLGIEHFTFHLAGPNELLKAGWEFCRKGYRSFWGPGRHIFGSNYFWYFNSPFGGRIEYDADMDLHDDSWVARHAPIGADTSQVFLLQYAPKWVPGGGEH